MLLLPLREWNGFQNAREFYQNGAATSPRDGLSDPVRKSAVPRHAMYMPPLTCSVAPVM